MTQRVHTASPYERAYGFARAVRTGDRVLVAGTAPIPQDGAPVPESAGEQMELCGRIAVESLERLGASVTDVVRTRMYITDPGDAEAVGAAHAAVFGTADPAATMVVVAALLDPAWKVEIEVEAVLDSTST